MKRSKERDRDSEKVKQPDKLEVICPLILMIANLAVNYDLTWQSETKLIVEDDGTTNSQTGVWKSNPVLRGHTAAFQARLAHMRETGDISWDESAYYFTHEEGIEARKAYEKEVLEGRLQAHITSWGPNPKKANDKSRFHRFTGVTFQALQEKYPEVYTKHTKSLAPKEEIVENKVDKEEPSESELTVIEEETVAAAVSTDEILEGITTEEDDESDDHTVLPLFVPSDLQTYRVDTEEAIVWRKDNGEHETAYLVLLPEIGDGDIELFLPVGEWEINGQKYSVRMEE